VTVVVGVRDREFCSVIDTLWVVCCDGVGGGVRVTVLVTVNRDVFVVDRLCGGVVE